MKTTLDYFKYLLLCVVVCAFTACSSDDDDNTSSAEIEIAEDMKAIAATGAGNDSKTITFTAKNDWTAIASHSWIDLSKRTGSAGDQTIIVTITDNEEFKTRIGTITIKDKVSGKTADIIVTQGEKNSTLTIVGNKGEDKLAGGTLIINSEDMVISDTVNIASNYDYTVTADVDWLQPEKVAAKNADGSTKYVFHADPVKLYAAAKYAAATAKVSVAYQTITRAPATKEYLVKFAGITPSIVSDASPVVLEYDGEIYKATIHVTSNIAWTLDKKPEFANVVYSSGENKSVQYFEANTAVTFTYNEAALQVEEKTGTLTFADAAGKALEYALNVKYPGVGNDYVSLDQAPIINSDRMCIFKAQGDPDPEMGAGMFKDLALNFTVKAANPENLAFYIARQGHQGASVYSTYIDEFGDEVSTEVGGYGWDKWGFVEDPETPAVRSVVKAVTKTLYVKSRGNEYNGSKEDQDRYFAFFAVSSEKYPTFADLFDAEGVLKPELETEYMNCMQKALGSLTDFSCPDLIGKTFNVSAAGEVLSFEYSGLDLTSEKWGASWTYGDLGMADGYLKDEPEEWTPGDMIMGSFGEYVEGAGTITVTVQPNTTGKARTETYYIFSGMEQPYYVFSYFTIKQAAE